MDTKVARLQRQVAKVRAEYDGRAEVVCAQFTYRPTPTCERVRSMVDEILAFVSENGQFVIKTVHIPECMRPRTVRANDGLQSQLGTVLKSLDISGVPSGPHVVHFTSLPTANATIPKRALQGTLLLYCAEAPTVAHVYAYDGARTSITLQPWSIIQFDRDITSSIAFKSSSLCTFARLLLWVQYPTSSTRKRKSSPTTTTGADAKRPKVQS